MTLKNSDFRICKGIYLESNDIAYTNHKEIVDSVIKCIDLMLENGAYTAIASHDDDIIALLLIIISSVQSIFSIGRARNELGIGKLLIRLMKVI